MTETNSENPGIVQNAISFDGISGCLINKTFEWQPNSPVTVEFWMYAENKQDNFIFSVGNKENPNRFCAGFPASDNRIEWNYGNSRCTKGLNVTDDFSAYLDKWTHLAFISAGKADNYNAIIVNGETVYQNPFSENPELNLTGLSIGAHLYYNRFFKGCLCDFRIWEKIRGKNEIKSDMNRLLTGSESDLQGYWPLNEGTGNIAHDLTKNKNHATLHGAGWITTEDISVLENPVIPASQSEKQDTLLSIPVLEFDGVDDYVAIKDFDWPKDIPVTVEFWVYVEEIRKSSVFCMGNSKFPDRLHAHVPWYDDNIYWEYGDKDKGSLILEKYNPYQGRWAHVALVSEGRGGTFSAIYINGGEKQIIKKDSNGPAIELKDLYLGTFLDFGHFFKGRLSDFRIWNRIRTLQEIKSDMHQRLKGDEIGLAGYWPLNENTGSIVSDLTENNKQGNINGPRWAEATDLNLVAAG